MWQPIIAAIEANQNFVITAHTNPDCDALGSELALAEHLKNLGKTVRIFNSDAMPEAFKFLDARKWVRRYSQAKHLTLINQADVIFVVDASGTWERTGRVGEACQSSSALKICVDHHPDPTDFVDLAVVNTDAAATAELIFDLVQAMGGQLTGSMAQALYAGIITDTGNFRYPKTNPHTHQVAAALLEAGVHPTAIYSQIYEQYPLGRVRLKGHVMDSIKTEAGGQLACYSLSRQKLKEYGVRMADLDGFASLGQEIGGVRATVFCVEGSNSKTKVSLRSDGSVAINQIAANLGGGGHPSAAGATVTGKLDKVLAQIAAQVEALLT